MVEAWAAEYKKAGLRELKQKWKDPYLVISSLWIGIARATETGKGSVVGPNDSAVTGVPWRVGGGLIEKGIVFGTLICSPLLTPRFRLAVVQRGVESGVRASS